MDFFSALDNILWYKNASKGSSLTKLIVKFKISNNFKQNIDDHKTHSKQQKIYRKIHTSQWI
jgi:hypothetical protein